MWTITKHEFREHVIATQNTINSITNDYGFSNVFDRQFKALTQKYDVVIGIINGETNPILVNALCSANIPGCKTIGLSGKDGGDFDALCDVNLLVSAHDMPRIQEMYILISHTICHLIELEFSKPN